MSLIQIVGIALSGLALAGLLVMLVELAVRRRLAFLGRRLGGWRGGLVRTALAFGGLATFVAGVHGLAVATERSARRSQDGVEAAAVTTTWRLPFYVEVRIRHLTADGDPLGEEARRTLQVPWLYLLWLGVYGGLTRRPPPDRISGARRRSDGGPRAPAASC